MKQIGGDGNCLFRSIADQLEGKQKNHEFYRKEAVKYIKDHPDDFASFVDDQDLAKYCKKLAKDGTWGG